MAPVLRDLPGVLFSRRCAAGERPTLDRRLALNPLLLLDLPDDGRRVLRLLFAAAAACFFLVTFASSSRPTSSLLGISAKVKHYRKEQKVQTVLSQENSEIDISYQE